MTADQNGRSDAFDAALIVGVHTTEVSRSLAPRTGLSLALESLRGALDDAGMTIDDIDGVYATISGWPAGMGQDAAGLFLPRQLNRPCAVSGRAFGISALIDAVSAIASGAATTVAIINGQCRDPDPAATAIWARPAMEFTEWTGSFTAVQYALVAQRYIHQFGDGAIEAMAQVSATIRNFGSINPDALYFGRGPFTPEDILASRPVASPLTLLMCSTVNDGGNAIIVTRRDRAADARKPIRMLTGGVQNPPYASYYDAPVLDSMPDEGAFVRSRMAAAGITHDDISLLQIYDHFAIGVLMELEMYGFCKPGEAADFVSSRGLGLDGAFPLCTDGGNHSFSHNGIPAMYRVIEAVRQLRGEVKDLCPGHATGVHTHEPSICRAVKEPELAFATSPGPPTNGGSFGVFARA
jgi:acetyl-CoA acetyltransferase